MESSKLTDEELIELAKTLKEEEDNDRLDVGYYQDAHLIKDGPDRISTPILYYHYKNWSSDPISLEIFLDMLNLNSKDLKFVFLDRQHTNINLERIIGDYVKEQRKRKKEERLREVSSLKSKIKRQDSF